MRADPPLVPARPVASLRRDPWRLFFPLAVVLGWAGVVHWLLYALGVSARYDGVFHATAQIQGFMTAMAFGFLFTFVPRRTGTAPPSALDLSVGMAAPVVATIAAWQGHWALAQVSWAGGVFVVTIFVGRRTLTSDGARHVPGVFVWVPVAFLAGVAGALLVAVAAVLGPHEEPQLWQLGRGLLLQGFVTALIVGVGGTMMATLTRGAPGPDAGKGVRTGRAAQIGAALLFLASFPVEVYVGPRPGFTLRGIVAGGVLATAAQLWRPPSVPGLHRRLIWLAGWLLPLGYLLAAVDPELKSAALHVTFIGAFALIALSVSLHVALSHGGHPEHLVRSPWPVRAMSILLLGAVAFRLLVGTDPAHLKLWLATAASCFLLATIAWSSLVLPAVRPAGTSSAAPLVEHRPRPGSR